MVGRNISAGAFAAAMGIPKKELFLGIAPVGYSAARRSLAETLIRATMKSAARKPWKELFFREGFRTPLTTAEAGLYAQHLEMVRLAPSATNAQPWRVCKAGDLYHFYASYKQGIPGTEQLIKQVDLGIALSHFHQTTLELGLAGKFVSVPQADRGIPDTMYYILSWKA